LKEKRKKELKMGRREGKGNEGKKERKFLHQEDMTHEALSQHLSKDPLVQ
jgi:hypothetical protein